MRMVNSKPKKASTQTLQRCQCGHRLVKTDGQYVFLKAKNYRIRIHDSTKQAQCPKCERWHGVDEPKTETVMADQPKVDAPANSG